MLRLAIAQACTRTTSPYMDLTKKTSSLPVCLLLFAAADSHEYDVAALQCATRRRPLTGTDNHASALLLFKTTGKA